MNYAVYILASYLITFGLLGYQVYKTWREMRIGKKANLSHLPLNS